MTLNGHPSAGAGPTTRQLQWPFVGVVLLLVVLILLTPDLFSTSGGGLQTRAQLIVDRATGATKTSFYIESIGTSTRYQSVDVGLVALAQWPYRGTASSFRQWNWTNGTETLVLVVSNATNPVVVNVSVTYAVASAPPTVYVGLYAFYLNETTQSLDAMTLLSGTSAPPASTPLGDLPIFILLPIKTPTGTS